ncbi:MAG: hypothetical protein Q7K03_11545, partial [Dehalococcoidia bacterium]|nr:hypothetical protein [Dehalococcoidia bacterium]
MIWLRRILAVLLIPLFIVLFLVALLLIRVNSTVLSADFYVDQLRKADIFTFMYDKAAPAALKEANKDPKDIPINVEKVGNKGVSLVKEVFPPQWLEEQTEQVIVQVVPYVVGDEDSFAVDVKVADRIQALGDVLKREMGGGDTYNLIFDDVIAPALKDAFDKNPKLGDLPLGMTITSQDVVAAVREVLPPEWAKPRVANVVDQVVPYLTGKSDHFAINLPVSDRVEAAGPALKKLLVNAKAYEVLNSKEFADAVDKQLKDFGALPFGVKLSSAQIVKALQDIAPPQWLQLRTEATLDAVVPYLAGKQDHFEVLVPVKDRIQVAVPVVKGLMRDVNAYNLLFDQLVVKLVKDNLGQQTALPLGVTLTSDEIVPVLRKTLPPEFIQQQTENMIDQVAPYLTGDSKTFKVVVPLKDRKQAAVLAIQELADKKLKDLVASMRPCTVKEALDLVQKGFTGSLPSCLPKGYTLDEVKQALGINLPGITRQQIEQQLGISLAILFDGVTAQTIKQQFGIDLAGQVSQFVIKAIPDDYTFTDVDLRKVLGDKDEEKLNKALDATRNGYKFTDADLLKAMNADQKKSWDSFLDVARNGLTYTDASLREDLGAENQKTLDQVLEKTRNGAKFTEVDLRKAISDTQGGQDALANLDTVRQYVGLERKLRPLLYLVPAMVLAGFAFLGGRRWRRRLAWAAVPLLFAAGLAYAASGPVYSA